MRSWGKQGFFNPPGSNDDGWFKFSIRKNNRYKDEVGFDYDIKCTIADCHDKIDLDFEPRYINTIFVADPVKMKAKRVKENLEKIKVRRAKVDMFRKAVLEFCSKVDEVLDEYEADLRAVDLTEPKDN